MRRRGLSIAALVALAAAGVVAGAARSSDGAGTPGRVGIGDVSWFPNSSDVAYVRYDPDTGANTLIAEKSDGSGLREIAQGINSYRISPDGSRIAYWVGLVGHLFIADADGTHAIDLGEEPSAQYEWSPDGKALLLTRTTATTSDIWIVTRDGSDARLLHAGSDSTWSPDGTKIAFSWTEGTVASRIYVMNADGTGAHQVGADERTISGVLYRAGNQRSPSWSPDGRQISFVEGVSCPVDYSPFIGCLGSIPESLWAYIANTDGGGEVRLGETYQAVFSPLFAWSPRSDELAIFRGCCGGGPSSPNDRPLRLVSRSGAEISAISGWHPNWAPDGHALAYATGDRYDPITNLSSESTIEVAKPDGTSPTPLARGEYPVWSPDSSRLALVHTCVGVPSSQVEVVAADDPSKLVQLTACPPVPQPPASTTTTASTSTTTTDGSATLTAVDVSFSAVSRGLTARRFKRTRVVLAAVPAERRALAALLPKAQRRHLKRINLDKYDLVGVFVPNGRGVTVTKISEPDDDTLAVSLAAPTTPCASKRGCRAGFTVVTALKDDVGSPGRLVAHYAG